MVFFFLMIRRPPRSTQGVSSAASDVYKRQVHGTAEAARAPPKELIGEKERTLAKAQAKFNKWSANEKELLGNLERVEQEQALLSSQFKLNSDELTSRNETLTKIIEEKNIAHEEELEQKEVEYENVKKSIEELDLEIRKYKIQREEEKSEITRAQLELERVEGNLHELEVDIALKTNYLNQLQRIIEEHDEENGRLATKLIDMKSVLLEFESQIRIYPAAELRKKLKILVNLRFYKTEDQQFCLEVASLKECRSYNILEIDIHVDKPGCLQVVIGKHKSKMELFECDYSNEIYEAFLEYRKMAADIEELSHPKSVSYTHLRAHETSLHLVCRLLLEKKKKKKIQTTIKTATGSR
eukprot:TRINITY_DN18561_c0_g1_i3.p1 TRINITY_DN18561_c0_g1~~TRINITY_DN18561_c0_g1_i3.p1  ORF type:complete len:355 (-),score=101.80 TRINITY_DN18561_c0_g1_i3:50-1114(-)